jgi:DNA-binding NarL/FixJ family response regulator
MINILLAEDHRILREGIKSLLKDEPNMTIVAEAQNGQEAIDVLLGNTNINLAICDINMPVMGGLDAASYISDNYKNTPVLILSMLDHEKYLIKAFEAGAKGYILKTSGRDELVYAIKKIANGESYISSEHALALMERVKDCAPLLVTDLKIDLTEREMVVLKLISEGLTNSEIADKTFTSRRTVETHRRNILDKTKTRNTAALIKFAILNRIIN